MKFLKKIRKICFYSFLAVLLFVCALYFARNLILSSLIEKGAERVFSAKAEMIGCDLQIFSGKLVWGDFAVADKNKPKENLFQTGYVELDFALSALLKGQFVCTNMVLEKLEFGTKREVSGALPVKESSKSESKIGKLAVEYLQKQKQAIPILTYQKMNVDSVLASCQLITPGKVDSLQKAAKKLENSWKELLKDEKYAEKARDIQERFNAIDFDDPTKALKELSRLYKAGNSLYNDSQEQRKEFKRQFKVLKGANSLDEWAKQDYNKVMQAVKFPDSQGYKMGEVLFGKTAYDFILRIIGILQASRSSLDAEKPKGEQKLRFWLKEMKFNSRLADGSWVKGEISNLSNAPKIVGKPIKFDVKLVISKNEKINFEGALEYQKNTPAEVLQVDLQSIRLRNLKLNQDALPQKIDSCLLDGEISFSSVGEDISLESSFELSKIVYSYKYEKKVSKQMKEIARLVGNSASSAWFKVDFASNKSGVKTSVKSSLDEIVKKALYSKFSSEKDELQAKLRKKINAGKYQKELDMLFKAIDQDVASILLDKSPISEEQKNKKKDVSSNLVKQGKKILEDSDLKNKAKDLIKGLKF